MNTRSKQGADRPRGRMQNFLLVWIDSNVQASNKDLQETLAQLRSVVNHIELFTQPADCGKFLAELTDGKAFVITSVTLWQSLVP